MDWFRAAKTSEIAPGEMRGYEVNGVRVGVAHLDDGEWRAFHDCCTHQQDTLSDSFLMGYRLTCDWHGAQFDLHDGEVKALPATKPLPMFEVEIRGDDVWVAVPAAADIDMPPL